MEKEQISTMKRASVFGNLISLALLVFNFIMLLTVPVAKVLTSSLDVNSVGSTYFMNEFLSNGSDSAKGTIGLYMLLIVVFVACAAAFTLLAFMNRIRFVKFLALAFTIASLVTYIVLQNYISDNGPFTLSLFNMISNSAYDYSCLIVTIIVIVESLGFLFVSFLRDN